MVMNSCSSVEIECPQYSDHRVTIERRLLGDYKLGGEGNHPLIADAFEIDCQICGKYE
jgi:hypothetical protein